MQWGGGGIICLSGFGVSKLSRKRQLKERKQRKEKKKKPKTGAA